MFGMSNREEGRVMLMEAFSVTRKEIRQYCQNNEYKTAALKLLKDAEGRVKQSWKQHEIEVKSDETRVKFSEIRVKQSSETH